MRLYMLHFRVDYVDDDDDDNDGDDDIIIIGILLWWYETKWNRGEWSVARWVSLVHSFGYGLMWMWYTLPIPYVDGELEQWT